MIYYSRHDLLFEPIYPEKENLKVASLEDLDNYDKQLSSFRSIF